MAGGASLLRGSDLTRRRPASSAQAGGARSGKLFQGEGRRDLGSGSSIASGTEPTLGAVSLVGAGSVSATGTQTAFGAAASAQCPSRARWS